jgi:beta-glucosidase
MTQNSYLNDNILKREWGFDGVLMSDWGATYDAASAANGGLDLEMPSGKFFNRKSLETAIEQGNVSLATIDDKVRRILHTAIRFGWLDREQTDLTIPRYNLQGRQVALEAARESMVLLKNDGGLLPLSKQKIRSIAVIGPNAHPAVPVGGGSAHVEPFAAVSVLEGMSNYLGSAVPVYYNRGIPTFTEVIKSTKFAIAERNGEHGLIGEYFTNPDLHGKPAVSRVDQQINFGNPTAASRGFPDGTRSIRWSGYFLADAPGLYEISANGNFYRLYLDDKPVIDSWILNKAFVRFTTIRLELGAHKIVLECRSPGSHMELGIAPRSSLVDEQAKKLASIADVVVLTVGFDPTTETEGEDRTFELPMGQEELLREITGENKNTIVVLTSGGAVDMRGWQNDVPAILESWYPGQEGGRALAEILFGEVNPSGRLPVTFDRRPQDNPTFNSYYPEPESNRVVYKEGVFVGYRGYERNDVTPLFPFGYGLSYTTFKYSNLSVKPASGNASSTDSSGPRYEVSFSLTNTGSREGAQIAQVYVGGPQAKVIRPAKELKGFAKVFLKPGERKRLSVLLDRRSFSYYDIDNREWRAESGKYTVFVGSSVEQIELRGILKLASGVERR